MNKDPTAAPRSSTSAGQAAKRIGSAVGPRSARGRIMAGIIIIIPLAVTALVIRYVYNAALSVGVRLVYYVSKSLFLVFGVGAEPTQIKPDHAAWYEIGIAVLMTVLMLYLLGWLGTNVAGRRFIEFFEGLFVRIPLVDTLYTSIKRMVQALSGVGKADGSEQRVVLIDFPHENMKTIGFMTNTIEDRTSGRRFACVFVPTTPNPTSGYMELVPIDRVMLTDLTIENALSMILSGGASGPPDVELRAVGESFSGRSASDRQAIPPVGPTRTTTS
jgi:uncharacterized membrane protein